MFYILLSNGSRMNGYFFCKEPFALNSPQVTIEGRLHLQKPWTPKVNGRRTATLKDLHKKYIYIKQKLIHIGWYLI